MRAQPPLYCLQVEGDSVPIAVQGMADRSSEAFRSLESTFESIADGTSREREGERGRESSKRLAAVVTQQGREATRREANAAAGTLTLLACSLPSFERWTRHRISCWSYLGSSFFLGGEGRSLKFIPFPFPSAAKTKNQKPKTKNRNQKTFTERMERLAGRLWNDFYDTHRAKFFKDRHWLGREWPELALAGGEDEGEGGGVVEVRPFRSLFFINSLCLLACSLSTSKTFSSSFSSTTGRLRRRQRGPAPPRGPRPARPRVRLRLLRDRDRDPAAGARRAALGREAARVRR